MLPTHVGIIMDGNRRFAKYLMKRPWEGHGFGIGKIRELLEWCSDLGIRYVTLYAFSIENFKRPKKEFKMIMNIFEKEFKSMIRDKNHDVHKHRVRIKVIGRRKMLSSLLQSLVNKVENLTAKYNNYFLNLAIAYGGRAEIVDACKKIGKKIVNGNLSPEDIDESTLKNNLYTNGFPDPDLIIRTSEKRLSGFLLWQSAYSELVFIPKLFPGLTKEDFLQAIDDYDKRERRFGK